MRAVVLVRELNGAAERRIQYASAMGGARTEALHVAIDEEGLSALRRSWRQSRVPVSLTVVAPSGRGIVAPVLDYVEDLRRTVPEEIVAVVLPEFWGWWNRLVRGWHTRRLATRLSALDGVAIVFVPSPKEGPAA